MWQRILHRWPEILITLFMLTMAWAAIDAGLVDRPKFYCAAWSVSSSTKHVAGACLRFTQDPAEAVPYPKLGD